MPDDRDRSFESAPAGWADAFAALPPETPDAAAWPRLQRALAQRRHRARWPAWFAAAAVMAIAAVLPWRLSTEPGRSDPALQADGRVADAPALGQELGDGRQGTKDAAQPAAATGEVATQGDIARTPSASPRDADSELGQLYAESAQLESLVAMARDERIASSGPAAALASQFDAQVAAIDARLVELGGSPPGAVHGERLDLWRERVDTLRGLASFESTQRLLAARGERYDAMLVSID